MKNIALVAHDNMKMEMIDWVNTNWKKLADFKLFCTGTTGKLIEQAMIENLQSDGQATNNLLITKLKSGPLGGDQQIGALIAEGKIDILIFFWDPMMPQPHEVDVKALLRIAVLYNIPTASTRSTADFIVESSLFRERYNPKQKDFSNYLQRDIK